MNPPPRKTKSKRVDCVREQLVVNRRRHYFHVYVIFIDNLILVYHMTVLLFFNAIDLTMYDKDSSLNELEGETSLVTFNIFKPKLVTFHNPRGYSAFSPI